MEDNCPETPFDNLTELKQKKSTKAQNLMKRPSAQEKSLQMEADAQ
jgi:hypothetical protein